MSSCVLKRTQGFFLIMDGKVTDTKTAALTEELSGVSKKRGRAMPCTASWGNIRAPRCGRSERKPWARAFVVVFMGSNG